MRRGWVKERTSWRATAAIGVLVIAAVSLTRFLGGLQPLEWTALDRLMRHRPTELPDDRVVIVTIDDEDMAQLKTYPISDRELAVTLSKLLTYQPRAIGLDLLRDAPVEPGRAELVQLMRTNPNLFAIEQLPFGNKVAIAPPRGVPESQLGYTNLPQDGDGYARRHLLVATDPRYLNTSQAAENYKFSLATQLAVKFLEKQSITPENGRRDPETIRFGGLELPRLHPRTGGYSTVDAGGTQVLLNYRNNASPFRLIPLRDVRQDKVQRDWLRDKVILIGSTFSQKDLVQTAVAADASNTNVDANVNINVNTNVNVQAHAVSQILAAVLDKRPLLQSWTDPQEYLWIVLWGVLGMVAGRWLKHPLQIVFAIAIALCLLISLCYGSLIFGLWIPLIPAALTFVLNSVGVSTAQLYGSKRRLERQLTTRQSELEQVMQGMHSAPLLRLEKILHWLKRQPSPPQKLVYQLEQVDREVRSLNYEIGEIADLPMEQILLGDRLFDLNLPLAELLVAVCQVTLERIQDAPGFKDTDTLRLIDIRPEELSDRGLSLLQKEFLCRFLEEALYNVGQHGLNVTQVQVFCGQQNQQQVIRVIDNGAKQKRSRPRPAANRLSGTQASKQLAAQLGGRFKRFSNRPQGIVCELKWPVPPS
jgi:CHASE2 domain-containing sensor protein